MSNCQRNSFRSSRQGKNRRGRSGERNARHDQRAAEDAQRKSRKKSGQKRLFRSHSYETPDCLSRSVVRSVLNCFRDGSIRRKSSAKSPDLQRFAELYVTRDSSCKVLTMRIVRYERDFFYWQANSSEVAI